MQPEQRIIADWMESILERRGWNYQQWADAADGVGSATTLSRAVKDDYSSVTSVKTLHALAKAAGEVSVLDFLAAQAKGDPIGPSPAAPSAELLERLLAVVLPLAPRGRATAQSVRVVAAALQHGLELLGDRSANPEPGEIGVAARGAVARLRDLTQQ